MPNSSYIRQDGHLTRDPELIQVGEKNTSLCKCGIATNTGFGNHKKTCFIDFVLWGKQAEIFANNHKKGDAVGIYGELELDTWKDEENNSRSKHKINGKGFVFLKSKDSSDAGDTGTPY